MALTRDEGLAGEDLMLFMHVRDQSDKNLVDPFAIEPVQIYSVDPDKALATVEPLLTLNPEKLSKGTFFVQFPVPITWCPGRYYDKWAVVVAANQDPVTTVQSFLIRSRSVFLDPGTQSINPEESPRITLLTKEARVGETKQIRFVLSKPLNQPLPPTEMRITSGPTQVLEWTPVIQEGNEGYLLVHFPHLPDYKDLVSHRHPHAFQSCKEEYPYRPSLAWYPPTIMFPVILRVQFRMKYGDQTYLTPINDLRLMLP